MSVSHQELKALLTLNSLLLGGAKSVHGLLWDGVPAAEILSRIQNENFLHKAEALENLPQYFSAEKEIETAAKLNVRLLTLLEPDYPSLLKHIADPPLVLYMKGSLCETDRAAVAVVGTRHPSFYGLDQARKFSGELAAHGFTIVSGLAQGIDQAAHEAALSVSHGRTIAVLGCGLDKDYPSHSRKLREAIAERGAIMSEYAFGISPRAENFPRRNRIIAGLSQGVLVVEAHSRSGSLITAHLAAEEGREVFAVPGPVDQLGSRGTHHLIKEGAALVENAEDILQQLGMQLILSSSLRGAAEGSDEAICFSKVQIASPASQARNDALETLASPGNGEDSSLLQLLKNDGLSYEEIAARSSLEPPQVFSQLTLLELQRKIKKTQDGRFCLARQS